MMAAAALICMTMTSVALISCGGDDDNDNVPSTPKSDNYTTSVMDFSYSVSDDALALVDFVVEYYDANGKLQSEKMTESTFTKTVKGGLPAYLGARLMMSVKDGVDLTSADKVTLLIDYTYSAYCVNDKGGTSNVVVDGTQRGGKMSLTQLERFVTNNSGLLRFAVDYTTDGKATKTDWK